MRFVIESINLLIVALTLFFTLTSAFSFPAQEQHTYTERTGDRKSTFVWKLQKFGNGVPIEASGEKEKLVNTCDHSGMTRDVFCRYESRHGLWGTPSTVIFLDRKSG